MALNLTKYEKFLEILPRKNYTCSSCNNKNSISRGAVRFSKRKYNGPFCGKCSEKL